jgi:hypothetical protein
MTCFFIWAVLPHVPLDYVAQSDDSYSDNSGKKYSSFDNVSLSALNEPHNTDFTKEKGNRKPNSRKRKTAAPSEWINK